LTHREAGTYSSGAGQQCLPAEQNGFLSTTPVFDRKGMR
jgi:hypothetical protein